MKTTIEAKKLTPSKPKFIMAIKDPAQLQLWLREHPQCLGLCMTGRSNVGKSSLINTLFGKGTARVSKTPGRTREVLIFEFFLEQEKEKNSELNQDQDQDQNQNQNQNQDKVTELNQDHHLIMQQTPCYLFDLPGYGHAEVSKQMAKNWNFLLSTFFNLLSPNVCVLNIQDARHPLQESDLQFQKFFADNPQETVLVFNKIDKLKTQKERAGLDKLKKEIYLRSKWVKQIYFVSAESKKGINELVLGLRTTLTKFATFSEWKGKQI